MDESKEQCAVVENSPSSSRNLNNPIPEEAVGNFIAGKRHMLVQDYKFAVQNLATACEMYADHYGELALDCAEVYFLYGKALFRLSQQQAGVLGDALNEGSNEDDESGNTSGEESKENESEKNSDEGEENDENEQEKENEPSESTDSPQQILDESSTEAKEVAGEVEENSKEVKNKEEDSKEQKNKEEEKLKSNEANEDEKSNEGNEDSKTNEANEEQSNEEPKDSAEQESQGKEDQASEEDDLELAWNTLETAKQIFKRQEGVQYQLKVAEILQLLAEISMESDNNQAAIIDLKECLTIQQKHLKPDDRILAETYYQMGLAQMLDKQYSDARENFKTTMDILELRIKNLRNSKSPDEKDSFKNADIDKEIQDLESILGDIKEKVEDTEELIRNTKKELEDAFANGILGLKPVQSAGESSTSSSSKPVSNITHLLKRKKPEEAGNEAEAKRLKTSTGVSNGESSVAVDTVSSSNSAA
ncbi:histone-binding protein N1/N2-like [Uloborus diversus]|uniref:histone-binding protein N1/N2-like n=1 Tax=Uloborus diversus TaxID=327109 RepID=UPI0024097EEA|nr:histone-binding protein N1/N2-like [Uloborus diversus]